MRPPDLVGAYGRAWKVRVTPEQQAKAPAAVETWYFHSEQLLSPLAKWRIISLASLADFPGVPPANKHFEDAHFELLVMTLNPDHPVEDPDNHKQSMLEPADVVKQCGNIGEYKAKALLDALVRECVNGTLVPDQDFRTLWDMKADAFLHS
jgi:hypothetical protein